MKASGAPPGSTADYRRVGRWPLLPVLLVLSLGARVFLALQGGQYFFGDEGRYQRGVDLWLAFARGRWPEVRTFLAMPEHVVFVWLTALLTPVHHWLAQFGRHGDWSDQGNIFASANIAAAVLTIFSVLNLWLVGRLARSAVVSDRPVPGDGDPGPFRGPDGGTLLERTPLHALRLELVHPATGAPLTLRAPLSRDIEAAAAALRGPTP
jgi:hypothetical protein